MILYFGNILSASGNNPSFIELLVPKLKTIYPVTCASDKKSKVLRLLDMVFTLLRHANKTKVVLIDTYSYQGFYYAWVIGLLGRLVGIPFIPIIRGGDFVNRMTRSPRLTNSFLRNAEQIVVPSEYLYEQLRAKGLNVRYIPNFIDLNDYAFKALGTPAAELFWVRSFHKIYNPALAIEVVDVLKRHHPNVHLTMAGPDKDGSLGLCQQLVISKALNENVSFTGKLTKSQIREIAKQKSIFINTTTIDNHPVSVIEAMALGLVVVTSNVGGIPYLVTHDENGILVSSGNTAEFVDGILRLLQDSTLAKRLQVNARAKVERFDWPVVKGLWTDLLNPYFIK